MAKKNKISELTFDPKNFNKGSEQGDFLLTKSIQEFGFREAATIDKNGVLIGGNKRTAKAGELGFEDLEIIKADPKKVYALQFDDIDINTIEGKRLALALNQTASKNITIDAELVEVELGEAALIEWGLANSGGEVKGNFDDEGIAAKSQFGVIVICGNDEEQEKIFKELTNLGYSCKVVVT